MRPRFLPVLVLLVVLGCGSNDVKVVPVSGTVTLDGKPPPKVYVNFQPLGTKDNPNPGVGSYAVTDEKGRYALRLSNGAGSGAVVGQHKVTIALQFEEDLGKNSRDTGSPDGVPLPRLGKVKQIPERYNSDSKLTFEVKPGGTDKADFALTSGKN